MKEMKANVRDQSNMKMAVFSRTRIFFKSLFVLDQVIVNLLINDCNIMNSVKASNVLMITWGF